MFYFIVGKKVEDCGVIEEDDEQEVQGDADDENNDDITASVKDQNKQPGYQIHSENKSTCKANKLASEVKSKMANKKTVEVVADSDDDVEDDVIRTKSVIGKDSVKLREENQQKIVDKTSNGSKVSVESGDLSVLQNGSSVDSGQTKCDIGSAINAADDKQGSSSGSVSVKECDGSGAGGSVSEKGEKSGKSKRGKKRNKGGKRESDKGGIQGNEDATKGGNNEKENGEKGKGDGWDGDNGKTEVSKSDVETDLSWKEANRNNAINPHRTQCAFDFSNAVMFDLDID